MRVISIHKNPRLKVYFAVVYNERHDIYVIEACNKWGETGVKRKTPDRLWSGLWDDPAEAVQAILSY